MRIIRLSFIFIGLLVSATVAGQYIWSDFDNSNACGSSVVQFIDSSYSYPGTIVQWQWNFGDPASGANNTSTIQNPSHNYSSFGTYTVSLMVTNNLGTRDTVTKAVIVAPGPVLNYPPLPGVCVNSGPVGVATAYVVNAMQGTGHYRGPGIDQAGYGVFSPGMAGLGTHTIWYIFTSNGGCKDLISQTISVTAKPTPNFTVNNTQQCVPATISFTSTSTAPAGSSYLWNFGDGQFSTTINPTHIYTTAGYYMVKLIITSGPGCVDSLAKLIAVSGLPIASIGSYVYDSTCANNLIYFTNTINNIGATYYWDYGDGATAYWSGMHSYATPGVYTVTLFASNTCGNDTMTQTVVVSPENKTIKPAIPGTLMANRQCEADSGWTNYYFDNNTPSNITDDTLLLSLKLNGQYIGMVDNGTFQLKLSATAGAGSNTGILLTNPLITNPTGYWVMNRYWNVQPANQPTSPVGVRFYFNTQDLNDVNGSYPTHNLNYNDLIFYKATGGNPDPTTNLAGATYLTSIMNGSVADTTHWVYSSLGGNSHRAEFAVSHFSGGGGGGTGNHLQLLPLKLKSFDAQKIGKIVSLRWTTAAEVNVRSFEVQRSADGREFNTIGNVAAIGNSGVGLYSFTDNAPLATTAYYRLKIADHDGSFVYSIVRTVAGKAGFDVVVYSNPVKDVLSLKMESEERREARIEVVSMEGRILRELNTSVNAGSTIKEINISTLQAGSYFIKVTSSGDRFVRRFVKSN